MVPDAEAAARLRDAGGGGGAFSEASCGAGHSLALCCFEPHSRHLSARFRPDHEWVKAHCFPFRHPLSVPNHWHAFLGLGVPPFPLDLPLSAGSEVGWTPFNVGAVGVDNEGVVAVVVVVVCPPDLLDPAPSCSSSASRCCRNRNTFD